MTDKICDNCKFWLPIKRDTSRWVRGICDNFQSHYYTWYMEWYDGCERCDRIKLKSSTERKDDG